MRTKFEKRKCICGHERWLHYMNGAGVVQGCTWKHNQTKNNPHKPRYCKAFTLDNLAYLQEKYEAKL